LGGGGKKSIESCSELGVRELPALDQGEDSAFRPRKKRAGPLKKKARAWWGRPEARGRASQEASKKEKSKSCAAKKINQMGKTPLGSPDGPGDRLEQKKKAG